MRYDNLPIYKACLDLCVYVETIVKNFEKYHKYSIGQDLRTYSKDMLFLIHKANIQKEKKEFLKQLVYKSEELKMLIHISKELKAFRSFKQFDRCSTLCIEVCKQSTAWYNYISKSAGVLR